MSLHAEISSCCQAPYFCRYLREGEEILCEKRILCDLCGFLAEIVAFDHIPKNSRTCRDLALVLVRTSLPTVALILTVGQLIGQIFV
jgi:hypothetical protein